MDDQDEKRTWYLPKVSGKSVTIVRNTVSIKKSTTNLDKVLLMTSKLGQRGMKYKIKKS